MWFVRLSPFSEATIFYIRHGLNINDLKENEVDIIDLVNNF